MRVLLTGACGYIGSVLSLYLSKNNIKFVGVDNLSNSSKDSFPKNQKLYLGDFSNENLLKKIFLEFDPNVIIHLAASISVEESEIKKKKYLNNNYLKSKKMFNFLKKKKISAFFFSSTAAVYSNSDNIKLEKFNETPSNYYGYTKKKFESFLLKDKLIRNKKIFRFFNVIGSHYKKKAGNKSKQSKHLVNNLCKSFYLNNKFIINGNTYKTVDGTAIRDFIDVNDICKIIIFFLKNLKIKPITFNLATENTLSVLQVVKKFSKISKKKIAYIFGNTRKGDAYRLICSNKKLRKYYNAKFITISESLKNHLTFFLRYQKKH